MASALAALAAERAVEFAEAAATRPAMNVRDDKILSSSFWKSSFEGLEKEDLLDAA